MKTQLKQQFDSVTLQKIKKSATIAIVGIVLTAGSTLGASLLDYIASGTAIDWKTPLIMSLSALGAFIYNTLSEWLRGQ